MPSFRYDFFYQGHTLPFYTCFDIDKRNIKTATLEWENTNFRVVRFNLFSKKTKEIFNNYE